MGVDAVIFNKYNRTGVYVDRAHAFYGSDLKSCQSICDRLRHKGIRKHELIMLVEDRIQDAKKRNDDSDIYWYEATILFARSCDNNIEKCFFMVTDHDPCPFYCYFKNYDSNNHAQYDLTKAIDKVGLGQYEYVEWSAP